MEPAQAMFNEANISRTLAVDALAGRCQQLAGEKAQLENEIAMLREELKAKQNENISNKESIMAAPPAQEERRTLDDEVAEGEQDFVLA